MTLEFPNPSRTYDESGSRVRFVGHDGMFQIQFSVDVGALDVSAKQASEKTYLSAFDSAKSSIHTVARDQYARTRKGAYALTSKDFK